MVPCVKSAAEAQQDRCWLRYQNRSRVECECSRTHKVLQTKQAHFWNGAKGWINWVLKTVPRWMCVLVWFVCAFRARARACEHVRAPVRADARVPCVRGGRTAYEVLVSCAGILDADNLLLATPSH